MLLSQSLHRKYEVRIQVLATAVSDDYELGFCHWEATFSNKASGESFPIQQMQVGLSRCTVCSLGRVAGLV